MNKKTKVLLRTLSVLAIVFLLFLFSCDQLFQSISMNLTATKGDYVNEIHLSWNEPTVADDDEDGYPDDEVIGYDIYRDVGGLIDSVPVSTTYYIDDISNGAVPDTEYEYYVDAVLSSSLPISSSLVKGYAIRKVTTTLWSTPTKALAHPTLTISPPDNLNNSTWHQVYLQKDWTYHFQADAYNASTPTFSYFRIYRMNEIQDWLVNVTFPPTPVTTTYVPSTSGYYWIRVEADDDFEFYAWYE